MAYHRRQFVSSLDVAAESARTGKVVVEGDRNRTKRVRAMMLNRTDFRHDPFYLVTYGAGGMRFTVAVRQRPSRQEPDGISVMHDGADGRQETAHFCPMIADLPAAVRPIVRDVQAAMSFTTPTRAQKMRERRRNERDEEHHARMRKQCPQWYPNGVFSAEAQRADMDALQRRPDEARERRLALAMELRQQAEAARAAGDKYTAAARDRAAQVIEDDEREDAA